MGEQGIALNYDGLRIEVRSTSASHLGWLTEFLVPEFACTPAGNGGADAWYVDLVEDAAQYGAIVGRGARAGAAPVACFRLEREFIRFPRWNCAYTLQTAVDELGCVAYEVDAQRRTVRITGRPRNSALRVALMRVVRELAMEHTRVQGGVLLHAAALAIGDRGLVILGDKDAGKTTLLINLLRHPEARYLSNDRVVVSADVSPPRLRGMPTIVSIRPGTLAMFPDLHQRLVSRGFQYRMSIAEADAAAGAVLPWRDGRFGVSPAQLCALVGVERVDACGAWALVFPRVVDDERGIRLVPFSQTQAAQRLRRGVFGAGSPMVAEERLFGGCTDAGHGDRCENAAVERLAAALPAFECCLGRDAYASSADAAQVAGWLAG